MKLIKLTKMRLLVYTFNLLFLPVTVLALPSAAEVFNNLGFSKKDQDRALKGELVITERSESSDRELTVVMVFIIVTPPAELLNDFYKAADYNVDTAVKAKEWIEDIDSIEAFQGVRLEPDGPEVTRLYIEADEENFNFSKEEATGLRGIAGENPTNAVEEQLRKILYDRYRSYRKNGLSGIPPYNRGSRNYQPSDDMRLAIKSQSLFAKYVPQFERTLLEYPNYKADGIRENFMWVNYTLDDLPTYVLSHRISQPMDGDAHVIAERHFYVSRSHNMVHIFAGMFPVEGGTLVFYENRTSTDRVAGFGSATRHALGRKIMGKQIAGIFEKYRSAKTRETK